MKCNQEGCTAEAIFTLVWTKQQFYCTEHAMTVIKVANAMGFPTPANTARVLTMDELLADDESDEVQS